MNPQITNTERNTILYYLFFIFVLPIILLYFDIINKSWRMAVLTFCCVLIYGIIKKANWTKEELGLTVPNRKKFLLPYFVFILIGVFSTIVLAKALGAEVKSLWWHTPHFWFLFVFVSYLQEFAYRMFLIPELSRIFPDKLGIIVISGLLFALLHVVYPVPFALIVFMFIGGMALSFMYMKYKDFWLIGLAHSIFNFVAVLFGFFVIH